MSSNRWQASIEHILQLGMTHAAVIDFQGNLKATSPGFTLRDGEGKRLARQFCHARLWFEGIQISGITYTFDNAKGRTIYGKQPSQTYCACTAVGDTILIGITSKPWSVSHMAGIAESMTRTLSFTPTQPNPLSKLYYYLAI